jgi:GntR family transcriptional regulator
VAIDRASPVPYYHQLRELIERRIDSGELAVDDQLPGEHNLCERYGVSRTVVRQALSDLEASGRVVRRKGKGTFVAAPKTAEGLVQSLGGLFQDVQTRGQELYSRVLHLERATPAPVIAELLELAPGEEIVLLERIRYVDGEPWVVTTTHLPLALAEPLLDMDMSRRSLYRTLEDDLGLNLQSARRTVEAARAGETVARHFGVEIGSPVLLLKSLTLLDDGRPVEYFVAWHRGDRSRFEVALRKAPDAGTPSALTLKDTRADRAFPAVIPGDQPTPAVGS